MQITKNVFTILLLTLIIGSCSKALIVEPSGNITNVTVPISNFSGIHVANGIQLFVTQDTMEKIVIETDDNIQKLYTAEKIGNNINIRLNTNVDFQPEQVVKVFISAKTLHELNATSGCVVKFNNAFTTTDFNLQITDGSTFNGSLTAKTLTTKVTKGSKITLVGKTDKFNLISSEGCQVDDFKFVSNTLDCKVSDGTIVNTTVHTSIDVVATDGATLNYKGNAVINSKTVNSGGQVNKL